MALLKKTGVVHMAVARQFADYLEVTSNVLKWGCEEEKV
jgi:hypothetical protein